MAKKKIGKKAWKNFEITKVALNPEQAVLSCCDQGSGRSVQGAGGGTLNCRIPDCGPGRFESEVNS